MTYRDLAFFGGEPAVTAAHPHEPWPPEAGADELEELRRQRNLDIGIRGNAGPIGQLEELFCETFTPGRQHAIAFNSGTSSLLAAYMALQIGPGDEVIAPVLTYHAAVSPARALGATVRLADIDIATRCIDPASVEGLITPATKAIVAVHQWGRAADLPALRRIADRHGVALVEDCSHAHGSLHEDRLVGTVGDLAAFSLQANKAVFAGEGGMLVTDDQDLADRAILAGHYRDRAKADVVDPLLRTFWESGFGLKLRMSPFNAIVAIHSVRAFPRLADQRQQALWYLNERVGATGLLDPTPVPDRRSMGAWYGYKPLPARRALRNVDRASLVRLLQAEGVEVGAPSGRMLARLPLFHGTQTPWRGAPGEDPAASTSPVSDGDLEARYPAAYHVEQNALSLPTFYRWPQDRPTIDQYLVAFAKVADALDDLPPIDGSSPSRATDLLPRDAGAHGR